MLNHWLNLTQLKAKTRQSKAGLEADMWAMSAKPTTSFTLNLSEVSMVAGPSSHRRFTIWTKKQGPVSGALYLPADYKFSDP